MSEMRTAVVRSSPPAYGGVEPPVAELLIGHSPAFRRLRDTLASIAGLEGPVLVSGEPGSGRSTVARALHHGSGRGSAPFVVVSCGGFPETLLETELFGCVKGSVVEASHDRVGVFDQAHGGTVVLEDVEEMTPRTQRLLIEFLDTGEVVKVGSRASGIHSDVRIVASTTARLQDLVTERGVSVDLWARLAARTLTVPALRDRRPDIPVLVDFFARVRAPEVGRGRVTFTADAQRALTDYSWPGNVRQLRGVVERQVATAVSDVVDAHDLPVGIRPRRPRTDGTSRGRRPSVGEELFTRIVKRGDSFWATVYPIFMQRGITRSDIRDVVRRGLDVTGGDQAALVALFNMPCSDTRRFFDFLRKYDCHVGSSGAPDGPA